MIEGAVWLHRKILDSSIWTTSHATRSGFITCLLLANYKDQQWYSRAEHKQIVIARGAFFTTREKFSVVSGLSDQQTRDCFKTLEDLNIITIRSTKRGTFITILNYDEYQKLGTRRSTDTATIKEPTKNQQRTRLEEGKEREERKEGGNPPLDVFVNTWQRREDRSQCAAEIAMGLKAYKLGYRMEEDIYKKIMGDESNGAIREQSISEQVAERRRKEGFGGLRKESAAGEILARIRGVPKVQPETETNS